MANQNLQEARRKAFSEDANQRIEEYEGYKKKAKKASRNRFIGYLIAAIVGVGLSLWLEPLIGVPIFIIAAFIIRRHFKKKKLEHLVEAEACYGKTLESCLRSYFDDLEFYERIGSASGPYWAEMSDFMKTKGDVQLSKNVLAGTYRGVKFAMTDYLGYNVDKDTGDMKKVYNDCIVTRLEYDKTIEGKLLIQSYSNHVKERTKGLNLIKMDNRTFEKNFHVYATDEKDAYYVISPSYMEKLINLKESKKGNLLFLYIDGNTVYTAKEYDRLTDKTISKKRPPKGMTKPGYFDCLGAFDPEEIERNVKGAMESIDMLIDDLDVKRKTFKMV